MAEYEITQRINAIISVNINANSKEEAEEKGLKQLNKGIFKSNISYIDGSKVLVGVTNLDLWNTEIE